MILYELAGTEDHRAYQALAVSNGSRQYDFLRSVVQATLQISGPYLSQFLIKALNFHAIACLHVNAGEYRPCEVVVGSHQPPAMYSVEALMDDFINRVNRIGDQLDPIHLAAYVLWRINYIHPFINGNGRTARAASYLVLCVKLEGWLPGETILPELLRRERDEYVAALETAHAAFNATREADLRPLHALIVRLLKEQLRSAGIDPDAAPPAPPALPPPQPA